LIIIVCAEPLTRLSRDCGIATLSAKRGEGLSNNYAGQDTAIPKKPVDRRLYKADREDISQNEGISNDLIEKKGRRIWPFGIIRRCS